MKKIIFLVIFIFLVTIIVNLIYSITTLWSKKDIMTQTQQKLVKEQQQNKTLQAQWKKVNTQSFIEEQARDKLFLAQPGDSVVLFPTATASGSTKVQEGTNLPVWEQWWKLFF